MKSTTQKLFSVLLLLLFVGSSFDASAQLFKKGKLKAKREAKREQVVKPEAKSPKAEEVVTPEEEVAPVQEPITKRTPQLPEPRRDLTPAQYDSLIHRWGEMRAAEHFSTFFDHYVAFDPAQVSSQNQLPDSVYVRRLRELASPIELPFNYITKAAILRYTDPASGLMGRVLGLSKLYFPMIEEELLKAGLPIELRAMAIIESALRYDALSRAGAAGLWQFMPSTGRSYGLEINSLVDERYDPLKATRAACRFLKDLYGTFGDWQLAIAAYNCGQGNVTRAMARSGGKTFWEIYDFLPRETRGYVPAFIAASYAYAYHRHHAITPVEPPMPLAVDTVHVNRLLHLGQVASTLDSLPMETLKMLNPQYRIDILPATTRSYVLTLPQYAVSSYLTHEEAIHAKDSAYLKQYLNPANLDQKRAQATGTIYHKVRRGETLGKIAQKYHVSQKNLMRWNGIKNPNKLREGQRLKIIRG